MDAADLAIAAAIVATTPHLHALRRLGRDSWLSRSARQLAGATLILPVLVAASSPQLTPAARAVLGAVTVALVTYDSVRLDGAPWVTALLAAAGCALAVALFCLPAASSSQGLRAAALLIVWYGLRGVTGLAAVGRLTRVAVVEYGIVAALAAAALAYAANHP